MLLTLSQLGVKVKIAKAISSILFVSFSLNAFAAEFPAQGRLFIGSTAADFSQVNSNLTADGMDTFVSSGRYGLEITYPWKFLNIGLRYHKTDQVVYEKPESTATNYEGELIQDENLLLARVPVFKQGALYADVFAGFGGTNTTYKLRTATQVGELNKKDPGAFVASPVGAAGVSVGVGHKNVYAFVEAGYEYNKVSSLDRTGSISAAIQEIDLSGSYVLVGLILDGIKATSQ